MPSYQDFREHYANRLDDELIDIARKSELLPEAQEALQDELKLRGIGDVAQQVAAVEADLAYSESRREANIEETRAFWAMFSRRLNYVCFALIFACLGGAFLLGGNAGAVLYVFACFAWAVIVIQWLLRPLVRFVYVKVLMRKI